MEAPHRSTEGTRPSEQKMEAPHPSGETPKAVKAETSQITQARLATLNPPTSSVVLCESSSVVTSIIIEGRRTNGDGSDTLTFFKLRVFSSTSEYTIYRRYTHFTKLAYHTKNLTPRMIPLKTFPGKVVFLSEAKLDRRQEMLQDWISRLVTESRSVCPALCKYINVFVQQRAGGNGRGRSVSTEDRSRARAASVDSLESLSDDGLGRREALNESQKSVESKSSEMSEESQRSSVDLCTVGASGATCPSSSSSSSSSTLNEAQGKKISPRSVLEQCKAEQCQEPQLPPNLIRNRERAESLGSLKWSKGPDGGWEAIDLTDATAAKSRSRSTSPASSDSNSTVGDPLNSVRDHEQMPPQGLAGPFAEFMNCIGFFALTICGGEGMGPQQ